MIHHEFLRLLVGWVCIAGVVAIVLAICHHYWDEHYE